MEASDFLRMICRRYGVPFKRAETLVPLVRRAQGQGQLQRRRLLRVVEERLQRMAHDEKDRARFQADLNDRCLQAVAAILHDWKLLPEER